MQKKVFELLKLLALIGLTAIFAACSGQQSSEGGTEEESTVVEEAAEETNAEETVEQRASPHQEVSGTPGGVTVVVSYGSPGVKGRTIYGDLVPYGKVWRTGADEATWVSFDKDAMLGETKVPAGKYAMFTEPNEGEWKVILNSVWDQWGAYDYDAAKDVATVMVTPEPTAENVERLMFAVEADGIAYAWADMGFKIPVAAAE